VKPTSIYQDVQDGEDIIDRQEKIDSYNSAITSKTQMIDYIDLFDSLPKKGASFERKDPGQIMDPLRGI